MKKKKRSWTRSAAVGLLLHLLAVDALASGGTETAISSDPAHDLLLLALGIAGAVAMYLLNQLWEEEHRSN